MALSVTLGTLGAPLLTDTVAPGFTGDVRGLTVELVKIMFSGVGVLVLSAWCLGVLNSHRHFFLSYAAPVLWSAVQVAALIVFGGRSSHGRTGQMGLVVVLAWATVGGAIVQLGAQLPPALRLLGGLQPSLNLKAAPVRRVLINFVPVVAGRGVVQLSAYVDQVLASFLGAATVAAMAYAQQLYLLPVSLFGMAISAAELPAMSSAVGSPDEVAASLRQRVGQATARMTFFVVPSAVAFFALGDVVVAALYQTGRFGPRDTTFVWIVLAGFSLGLRASTRARLCASAFYALDDTRTPFRYAVVRVTVTALLGWVLALPLRRALGWPPQVGAAGLAVAAGLAGWTEFLLLSRALARRIGPFAGDQGKVTGRIWVAALLAGALAFLLHRGLSLTQPVVAGAAVLGAFGTLYLSLGHVLGLAQARQMTARLWRAWPRRPGD